MSTTQPESTGHRSAGKRLRKRVTVAATVAGFFSFFGPFTHKCDLGVKWFEDYSPLIGAALCGGIAFGVRRYWISLPLVVLIVVLTPWFLGPWYRAAVHGR
jgi:hypothetical protein